MRERERGGREGGRDGVREEDTQNMIHGVKVWGGGLVNLFELNPPVCCIK